MENAWTSVNKGFPERCGEVWVTIDLGTYRDLQRCWYENGHFYDAIDDEREASNVIAWMPMNYPEPYDGE